MNENDIAGAIFGQLLTVPDIPFILDENEDLPEGQKRPYAVLEMEPGRSARNFIGGKINKGFAQLRLVWDINVGPRDVNVMAERIADAFPYGLSLPCGDGTLTVDRDTRPGPGYRVGADFNKVVQIDYLAI